MITINWENKHAKKNYYKLTRHQRMMKCKQNSYSQTTHITILCRIKIAFCIFSTYFITAKTVWVHLWNPPLQKFSLSLKVASITFLQHDTHCWPYPEKIKLVIFFYIKTRIHFYSAISAWHRSLSKIVTGYDLTSLCQCR